jgi:uncharacterized membrane protein
MRVGTFLLGGIAGAAAVVYLNRKTKSMMFKAFNSSSSSMGKMMDKAKDTFTNTASSNTSTSQANQGNQTNQTDNFEQLQKTVKGDPVLHSAVNEILAKAEGKSTTMH